MKVEGGCYCGAVRYQAEGAPLFKAACFTYPPLIHVLEAPN